MGDLMHNKLSIVAIVLSMIGLTSQAIGADSDQDAGIFASEAGDVENLNEQGVKVGSFGEVDLHVKDLEISKVLQLLSLQSQRNIIASRNVAGTISADLYKVDFYEALDAILHTNGFGYQEKGNLVFVYTAAEMQKIIEAQRQPITRIVNLNYITAADASAFVSPLLSSNGSIAVSSDVSAGFQPSISDGGANSFAHADTLIIRDYEENVEEIVAIIAELDKRPSQVLVEATILQARLTETNAFGVDLSILADFALSNFGDPIGIVQDVITGTESLPNRTAAVHTTLGNTPAGNSGVKVGIITHSVAGFIRALDTVTDTSVLANPKLLVLNRQKAELLVGEKLGYLSSTATDTSTTQTVEFLEVGTQLTLRPFVSDDGFIRIELKPSISDGNTNRTVGTFVIPETTNQEMTTNVVVRNGQTVVLGGLFKEDTEITNSQVPLLGDIPVVGTLFQGQDDTVTRNEVIFLITPTIVKDDALYAMGERTQDSIELAQMGAREGLLPWSRTKMLATYIRDAQSHYEGGSNEKALWAVNMALTLDPKSVEAVQLKEKLTGQRAYRRANFSILSHATDSIIRGQIGDAGDPASQGSTDEFSSHEPYTDLNQEPADDSAPSDGDTSDPNNDPQAKTATDHHAQDLQGFGHEPVDADAQDPDAEFSQQRVPEPEAADQQSQDESDSFNAVVDWLMPTEEEKTDDEQP